MCIFPLFSSCNNSPNVLGEHFRKDCRNLFHPCKSYSPIKLRNNYPSILSQHIHFSKHIFRNSREKKSKHLLRAPRSLVRTPNWTLGIANLAKYLNHKPVFTCADPQYSFNKKSALEKENAEHRAAYQWKWDNITKYWPAHMLYILEAKLLFSGMYKIIINMHQNKWEKRLTKSQHGACN